MEKNPAVKRPRLGLPLLLATGLKFNHGIFIKFAKFVIFRFKSANYNEATLSLVGVL
jgi:hypothetical protein